MKVTLLSISRALKFLSREQLDYGEFRIYLATDKSMSTTTSEFDSSPFCTALIIYCLNFVDTKEAKDIIQRAVQFLVGEREKSSLWRYWSSRNPKSQLCPPDLDDTACISYVLKQHYSSQLYSLLFVSNRRIILNQRNDNGLFRTFIATNLAYNPVDSVVNANTMLYLGDCFETKDACNYLCDLILNGNEAGSDSCYKDPISLYYFVSRAYYRGIKSLDIIKELTVQKVVSLLTNHEFSNNSLYLALSICSLLNFDYGEEYVLSPAIQNLLNFQKDNGSWPRFPMWQATPESVWGGESSDWIEGFWGSEELTTAFCIEALVRYVKLKGVDNLQKQLKGNITTGVL